VSFTPKDRDQIIDRDIFQADQGNDRKFQSGKRPVQTRQGEVAVDCRVSSDFRKLLLFSRNNRGRSPVQGDDESGWSVAGKRDHEERC
jgi:hypothetical protein